jgi:hypothetical protein
MELRIIDQTNNTFKPALALLSVIHAAVVEGVATASSAAACASKRFWALWVR